MSRTRTTRLVFAWSDRAPQSPPRAIPRVTWPILAGLLELGCAQLSAPDELLREPVRIPIELSSSIPFLPVRIDGSAPFSFVLDSGFQNSAVDWAVAERLGLAIGPEET